jgi:hypothetical protein
VPANHAAMEFIKRPRGGQKAVQAWGSKQQRAGLVELKELPKNQNVFITPSQAILSQLGPKLPRFLVFKMDNVIPSARGTIIWKKWKKLNALYPIKASRASKCSRSNDGRPQRHLGKWSHYRKCPYFTKETRTEPEEETEEQALIDDFLSEIRNYIAPLISQIMERYEPGIVRKMIGYNVIYYAVFTLN